MLFHLNSLTSLDPRYVFAIIFTDVSNAYADGTDIDISLEALNIVRLHFFDIEVSIISLFQSISNGLNWGDVASALKEVSRFWSYLYIAYVAFSALPSALEESIYIYIFI